MSRIGTTICTLALAALTAFAGCSKEAPKRENYNSRCASYKLSHYCGRYSKDGKLQIFYPTDTRGALCFYTEGNKQNCNRVPKKLTPEAEKAVNDLIESTNEAEFQLDSLSR